MHTHKQKGALVGVADHRLPKLHCHPADGMFNCKGPVIQLLQTPFAEVSKRSEACHCWPEEKARFVSLLHTQQCQWSSSSCVII